jgi:hypothetical protein
MRETLQAELKILQNCREFSVDMQVIAQGYGIIISASDRASCEPEILFWR